MTNPAHTIAFVKATNLIYEASENIEFEIDARNGFNIEQIETALVQSLLTPVCKKMPDFFRSISPDQGQAIQQLVYELTKKHSAVIYQALYTAESNLCDDAFEEIDAAMHEKAEATIQ